MQEDAQDNLVMLQCNSVTSKVLVSTVTTKCSWWKGYECMVVFARSIKLYLPPLMD